MAIVPVVKVKKDRKYGTYYLEYNNRLGRRRRPRIGPDEKEAHRWAVKFGDWLLEGRDPEKEMQRAQRKEGVKTTSLKDFFPIFMEKHGIDKASSTKRSYRTSMKNFYRFPELTYVPLNEISRKVVREYLKARIDEDGISNRTANIELGHLSLMLDCAVEEEYLDINSLYRMKKYKDKGKRDVKLRKDQVKELLSSLKGFRRDMMEILLDSGLRKGELLTLRIEEIVFNDSHQIAIVNKVVKGGKRRSILVHSSGTSVLKRVIGQRTEGYVFINSKTGKPYVSIHKGINRVIRQLGLQACDKSKLRIHDARHVVISDWYNSGVRLEDIQIGVGHSNKSTTERYITPDVKAVGKRIGLIKMAQQ